MCRAKKEENNGAAPLRSVSGEVFATFASLLLVALVLMCMLQTGLSCAYFAQERKSALTAVLDGATAMAETYASEGNIVTLPGGDNELVERAKTGFELFNTSSDALVFVADRDGNILMHTGKDVAESAKIPQNLQEEMDSGKDIFLMGTMDDTLHDKYYIAGRRVNLGGSEGYLFAATPVHALAVYIRSILTMFLLSSAVILIVCGILCMVLARRITWPIEQISQAAKRLGGGDFTARAPVTGCQELADFATTFNNMAGRLQNIDNSRGQFMGNIAHELRTPMTSIKGFIDGMLDGTIPESEYKHYLGVVSQETGRLARLVQNMLDITKLESGEVKGTPKNYDIWSTVTDVVLSDERVLVVDMDAQGNCTYTLTGARVTDNTFDRAGVYDMFRAYGISGTQNYISRTQFDNIDIIPANGNTPMAAKQLQILEQSESTSINMFLAMCLAQVAGEYDYILIDTPPSRDVMVTNALMASDFVLIPCVCDDYSRDSVYRTVAMCQQLEHDEGEKIDVLGIILTMVEKTALTEVIRNELRESQLGSKLFAAEIRKGQAVKDSTRLGAPVVLCARSSNPAKDYAKVYAELKTRIEQEAE